MAGDIIREINFFSHTTDGSLPYIDVTPKLGCVTTNFARKRARVTIHDLRGKENSVDLDRDGFEVLKYDGHMYDEFDDNSETQRSYYEEIAARLKKRLGASRVIIFNHIFRFRGSPLNADQCDHTHKNPAGEAHVDSDPPSVRWKVEQMLGKEEAKKVMQNRFQLINIWRPLGPNPIINMPLTICDYRSLDLVNDIHVSEHRGTQNSLSGYQVSHNAEDAQKWFYLSRMRSDEMFVFKIFDSNPDVAQFAAHTAFVNEDMPLTNAEQKSIEMRCLVFYDQ